MTNLEQFEEAIKTLSEEQGITSTKDAEIFLLTSISILLAEIADALNNRNDCDHCIYKMEADDDE